VYGVRRRRGYYSPLDPIHRYVSDGFCH
jgi:hypothetical protein